MISRLTPLGIGWLAGSAWQLQERELMASMLYWALMTLGGGLIWASLTGLRDADLRRWNPSSWMLGLGACAMAFGLTGWRAHAQLASPIEPRWEGVTVEVVGVVAAMPQHMGESWRFRFEVEHAPPGIPSQLLLGWYGSKTWGSQDVGEPPPWVRAGDRWRLPVRLKAPHGHMNPHGFDYELWLWEQKLQATGYVRAGPRDPAPVRLGTSLAHPIERWRQDARESIERQIPERAMAGIVAALLVGDQAAIERADWDVFRITGVAHLMSISGLHITGLAWLAAALTGWFWRRSSVWSRHRPWCLGLPAPHASHAVGCAVALIYALFTGWGLPAQRTVWMLLTATWLRWHGLRWPWTHVWLLVCVVVVVLDPWALLQAGFWLSFVAVGVLFASGRPPETGGLTPAHRTWLQLRQMVHEQWLMSVCLAPLSLVLFHQVSVIGLLANLLAVPWVTLMVTPLCLLGLLWSDVWTWAQFTVQILMRLLTWMAQASWAQWSAPASPGWVSAAALLGVALWARRMPGWLRLAGLVMVLPLLTWQTPRPSHGTFELIAADMGQGHAVLVRTQTHALLYDTGPRYSAETDAGQRVLVPLLRSLGERLDGVMISHQDSDHSGGAPAVLAMQPQAHVWSSTPATHFLNGLHTLQHCQRGQHWEWDGVQFSVLHPNEADYVRPLKPNAMSCVLRLQSTDGVRALLVGDIEAAQEQRLIQSGQVLQADWLLVPHHGSATSSTTAFLEAVQPQVAVVQAGYRNRFGHPRSDVLLRYSELGVQVVQSPRCGASRWQSDQPKLVHCTRDERQRYWHHRIP